MRIARDESMPLVEQVREITLEHAGPDDELDYTRAARMLGCSAAVADAIDEELTIRHMVALGVL